MFHLLGRTGGILDAASELVGAVGVDVAFNQAQVALNIGPRPHRPGRPHIDGYAPGRHTPGTFTLLAGLLLTDQLIDNGGNLWVWPGGNDHCDHTRRAIYWRLRAPGHADRWAACLSDAWHEYPTIRHALDRGGQGPLPASR